MRSIRRFLIFYLLCSITIIFSLTTAANYFLEHNDIKQHFDMQLKQSSIFLETVLSSYRIKYASLTPIQKTLGEENQIRIAPYARDIINDRIITADNLQFQVWDQDGHIVLHSLYSKKLSLPRDKMGFYNAVLDQQPWRIYTHYNQHLNMTLSLAEPYKMRETLEQHLTWDALIILLASYPLLGLLIWFIIDRGLISLQQITHKLGKRDETDFTALNIKNIPIEILPLVNALNTLLQRLKFAFERNKRFAANAAHELRTPLAALKTQTQIALLNASTHERKAFLENIIIGVDRASHVVQQMLTLSRLGQEDALHENMLTHLDLSKLTSETLADLTPTALKKNIDITFKPAKNLYVRGNHLVLSLLISNLVDNAIRYTPEYGKITVSVYARHQQVIVSIADNGPGIPEALHERVFERFYRVLEHKASGSGLGLAIVKQIAILHHATVTLTHPKKGTGLVVIVAFPAHKPSAPKQ